MKPKLIRITTVPLSLDKLLGEQLRYMNQYFDVTAISADEKELQRVAEKYGVKYYHVEMTRKISPFQDLKAVWKLYQYLKKEKPEIIHSHTPKAGIVSMMAGFLARIPVRMHTVAGLPLLEATGGKRKLLNLVERITYYFATNVYPNSRGLLEIIQNEKFCNPNKLKVIGNGSSNGIDTDYFNPQQISEPEKQTLRNNLKISENDFVFIFVGRLVKDKGINELVEAFKQIQNSKFKIQNTKLLLVGPFEQDLDPLFSETIDEIEHNPNIVSVGFQEDVRPYFAISNALVFPSYREGFPNVVLQAGAMGLPSIVTNINGCNEIVTNDVNGILISSKSVEDITNAMLSLLNDKNFYQSLKEYCRDVILNQFEQKEIWKSILKEYESTTINK